MHCQEKSILGKNLFSFTDLVLLKLIKGKCLSDVIANHLFLLLITSTMSFRVAINVQYLFFGADSQVPCVDNTDANNET